MVLWRMQDLRPVFEEEYSSITVVKIKYTSLTAKLSTVAPQLIMGVYPINPI